MDAAIGVPGTEAAVYDPRLTIEGFVDALGTGGRFTGLGGGGGGGCRSPGNPTIDFLGDTDRALVTLSIPVACPPLPPIGAEGGGGGRGNPTGSVGFLGGKGGPVDLLGLVERPEAEGRVGGGGTARWRDRRPPETPWPSCWTWEGC